MNFALGEKERRVVMRLIDADELLTAFPVCGLYAYRYENGRPWESDYCPYCGADMRGEQL
jgi:hypothetical protein